MKCFSACLLQRFAEEPDNSVGIRQTSIQGKVRVSDNRTVPVMRAGKDDGYHRKYLLHGLKYRALPHLHSALATSQ